MVISYPISNHKKRKIQYIYTVTCIYDISSYYRNDSHKTKMNKAKKKCNFKDCKRCFGWFPNLRKAKKTVENNSGDIHEYLYNYAVIEKVAEGIHGGFSIPKEWWYKWKWEGSSEKGKYMPIDKPKEIKRVIMWGIG